MNKELIQAIREEFDKLIALKNGWGKNEVMKEYDKAVALAVLRFLDKV